MSTALVTCENHGDEVVVVYGNSYSRNKSCPLCDAETKVADLEKQVEDLIDDRDELQKQVEDLESDLREE